MAIRIKTSPSEDRLSEKVAGKQETKFMNRPKEHDTLVMPGSYPSENFPFRNGSLASSPDYSSSDHRTFFNSSKVEQWVANSASGSDAFSQFAPCDQPSLPNGNNPSLPGVAPEMPGPFSVSRSTLSRVSLQHSTHFAGPDGPLISYNDPCAINVTEPNAEFSQGFEPEGVDISRDLWPYQTPVDDDSFFSNSAAVHPTAPNDNYGFFSEWTAAPVDDFLCAPVPCASQSLGWSPLLVADPSVSSSYSQSSILVPQPHTPLSPATQEEGWCAVQRGNLEEETAIYPHLSIGDTVQLPSRIYTDGSLDSSTLEHARVSQSVPISHVEYYMATPVRSERRPNEGETTTPREHPLYHVGPADDGLYHCPFAGSEECTHKAEKLKCNYDKHLDSHLKPYRCKVASCIDVRFSSTACLLRHEREAHGMHGHGDKPHLCHFSDCERSTPGNGFPRRWNLRDHMKRVHFYTVTVSASSRGSSSPTPSSDSSVYQGIPSKRRASTSQPEVPKRAKAGPCTKPIASTKSVPSTKSSSKASKKKIAPATSQGKQRQNMDKEWHEKKAVIKAGLECLDPNDVEASDQITADCQVLRTIGMRIRHLEASQLAS